MKKGYCEKCNEIVEYNIKDRENVTEIKGKTYKYLGIVGICKKCGEYVSSPVVDDENLRRLDNAFRSEEGLITKEQINEIIKKYRIGKKPLSKLLGWGEVTLTRYINGDVPTKPYSDELIKILNDEKYMESLLEKNKNNITDNAYRLVKNAIKESSNIVISDIELIAQYIVYMCKEITPLALQKILYYAQGFYSAFWGEYLYKEDCEAWVHGPVYTKIYDKYKVFSSSNIEQFIDYDIEDILNEDKKTLLDVIVNCFGYYNGKALEKMTHFEQPWVNARRGISADEKSNNVIPKEEIKEYFLKVIEKYDMINLLEIKKYSDELFNRIIAYNN